MGNLCSISISTGDTVPRCCHCIVGEASYTSKLEDNLKALKKELAKLNARRDDVNRRVDLAEQQHMELLNEVQLWLSSVQAAGAEAEEMIENAPQAVRDTRSLEDIYSRCNEALAEPANFKQAKLKDHWKSAMDAEMQMITKNETWTLVDRPTDKNIIKVKWIYRTKLNPDGSAPKAWNKRIDDHFKNQGFQRSMNESTLYVKKENGSALLIVALYGDDLLISGPKGKYLTKFKAQMQKVFEITDLGEMTYFLGMEIIQSAREVVLHQGNYAKDLLNRFNMGGCKAVSTPLSTSAKFCKDDGTAKANGQLYRSIIGSLLYLVVTRPDIMFATCLVSRFMQDPSEIHFATAKRVVAQSTAEAEYIACLAAANHALWLRKLLVELGFKQVKGTLMNVDNQSAIAIVKNLVQHERTKHI
ncbi:Uncharacterized protein TCM_027216 [Theobroma cacao]|uniref:Reverse transcriptase Ty1/copia-type domain-containing protein n=1 Tax=Theobroma cacao TaxID=3641 RepID=A0A061G8E5_THECC|nr:Uncharacterized protein TCM_027216 [Theobroma cacao]